MDDFKTDERIMIANLPTQGVSTVYSCIGDLFAWLCVVGFLGLMILAVKNRKKEDNWMTKNN